MVQTFSFHKMNIAITGATGHIGNCLASALSKQGHNIKVLMRNHDSVLANPGVDFVQGDILKPETLPALCNDADVVFHLAAQISIDNQQSDKVYQTNVIGTQNILNASINASIKKFIHFSSISAFSSYPLDQVLDEDRALTESTKDVYGHSKAESEKLVIEASNKGLDAVILCPTGVFGPNDYRKSYLGQAIKQIYLNKYPMLVAGGFNWVDVRDVVTAAISAVEKGRKGHKYIISGHYYSLKNLSVLLGRISDRKTPTLVAPISLVKLLCPLMQFYAKITNTTPLFTSQSLNILSNAPKTISTAKAQNDLAYKARPFEQSLRDTIEWYKTNNYLT